MIGYLSRRHILASGLAAAAFGARASTREPRRAADFIGSIGVNTHISSEPYASRFVTVQRLVAELGIRHLRDELRPTNDLGRWKSLFDHQGVMSHLLVSPATNTIEQMTAYINRLGRERISCIEGQNEGNADWFMAHKAARGDWARTVVACQRDVFERARQLAGTAIPIVSPSVINWKPADMALLRNAAPYCDYVAIHSYPQHAEEPETKADYAALGWYLKHMRDAFKPGAPVMATETGYNNTVKPGGSGVSERAASIYLPRMLLHNFSEGVARTFLYQLLDGGDEPGNWEHHFGLVRHDDTPKPAFTAIANLIAAVQDAPERSSAQGPLRIALDADAPSGMHVVQLSHTDGTTTAAIWRAERSWNVEEAADIEIAEVSCSLTADRTLADARVLIPNSSRDWRHIEAHGNRVSIPVADRVVLVRMTPAA